MVDSIRFSCGCTNSASHWIELSQQEMHRYRVECGSCGKFIKWGKEQELHHRVASKDKVTVTPNEGEASHRKTIEDFL